MRQEINTWVESQTGNKIKDLLPGGVLNALTTLVLVNAIYFKVICLLTTAAMLLFVYINFYSIYMKITGVLKVIQKSYFLNSANKIFTMVLFLKNYFLFLRVRTGLVCLNASQAAFFLFFTYIGKDFQKQPMKVN